MEFRFTAIENRLSVVEKGIISLKEPIPSPEPGPKPIPYQDP